MANPTLDAVNYLLGLLGSNPVSDVINPHPLTAKALSRLADANLDIQGEGWWFNKEYHYDLPRDIVTGEIEVPFNVLELTVESRNAIVFRDFKLYDTVANSFQFTEDAIANIIVEIPYDELPKTVRNTIKYFAGIQVCDFDLEDGQKSSKVEKFYTKNYSSMKKTQLRSQRRNILNSPATAKARSGVRPYRSGSSRNPLYPGG